ncbi:hypothetical protein [Algoriphagus sp. A40]|uniref:hypothetical protein n=1 Tax=Algoriphagus sp. A40 TaxID=1945863 RepID=UPI000985076B|nr:hypothetical protein [Algoriphagus sp. A40]OOG77501.1 hypothetical protein B0E43_05215 [Algoriphagus sp. A40]
MSEKVFFRTRLYFTGFATLAIAALLTWNYFNGGVPSHHVLADESLPLISNWWGALLIPSLTWFLTYRIQKRVYHKRNHEPSKQLNQAWFGFVAALIFGSLLAAFFTFGFSDLPGYMLLGLLLAALFLPIYRAECLLGFVFGMTYTFGAVLPTLVGCILALIGAAIYLLIRRGIIFLSSKLVPSFSADKK